jgi:hypothetical protein
MNRGSLHNCYFETVIKYRMYNRQKNNLITYFLNIEEKRKKIIFYYIRSEWNNICNAQISYLYLLVKFFFYYFNIRFEHV